LLRVSDELAEQRMGSVRAGPELGMKLSSDHERMVADFADFDQAAIWGSAARNQSEIFEGCPKSIVELITVAVTFPDLVDGVSRLSFAPADQVARIAAEAHRAALLVYDSLFGV